MDPVPAGWKGTRMNQKDFNSYQQKLKLKNN